MNIDMDKATLDEILKLAGSWANAANYHVDVTNLLRGVLAASGDVLVMRRAVERLDRDAAKAIGRSLVSVADRLGIENLRGFVAVLDGRTPDWNIVRGVFAATRTLDDIAFAADRLAESDTAAWLKNLVAALGKTT